MADVDEATVAAVDVAVNQYSAAVLSLEAQATKTASSVWDGFTEWYTASAVAANAAETALISSRAQQVTTGLAREYMSQVLSILDAGRPVGSLVTPTIRNGIDPAEVYKRVAAKYAREFALSADEDVATNAANLRLNGLIGTDLALSRRQTTQTAMSDAGIRQFRRVIHPELSESGTCGLCLVAANRIYNVAKLMPIHGESDKCTQVPIVGGKDVGVSLNDKQLKAIYAAAGSSGAADLKRIRIKTYEHGELGPVLANAKHATRGPRDVLLQDDPARATRMLDQLRPNLLKLEDRAAAGEDLTEPLRYQRGLIAQLEAITNK